MQISSSLNHMLSFTSLAFSPPPPKSYSHSLTMKHTLNSSSSICFPLSVSFLFHSLTHKTWIHTHMHISLCPDTGTPLYPPFRLGATRLIHLHSSRGERGATRGTNTERKRRGRGLRKSHVLLAVIWERLYCIFYTLTVTIRQCGQRQRSLYKSLYILLTANVHHINSCIINMLHLVSNSSTDWEQVTCSCACRTA